MGPTDGFFPQPEQFPSTEGEPTEVAPIDQELKAAAVGPPAVGPEVVTVQIPQTPEVPDTPSEPIGSSTDGLAPIGTASPIIEASASPPDERNENQLRQPVPSELSPALNDLPTAPNAGVEPSPTSPAVRPPITEAQSTVEPPKIPEIENISPTADSPPEPTISPAESAETITSSMPESMPTDKDDSAKESTAQEDNEDASDAQQVEKQPEAEQIKNNLLRQARAEVAGRLGELGPKLAEDPDIIKKELESKLIESGVELKAVSPALMNKLERHTIVAHMARVQGTYMIEGEGRNARYIEPLPNPDELKDLGQMEEDMLGLLESGLHQTIRHYSNPEDPVRQWWQAAEQRYHHLGRQMIKLEPHPLDIVVAETLNLRSALTSTNFVDNILQFSIFINDAVNDEQHNQLAGAHDLAYLLTTRANMSLARFRGSLDVTRLTAPIIREERTGKLIVRHPKKGDTTGIRHDPLTSEISPDGNWSKVFPKSVDNTLSNTLPALQCPVNTAPGNEDPRSDETLTLHIHAAINLLHEHDLIS